MYLHTHIYICIYKYTCICIDRCAYIHVCISTAYTHITALQIVTATFVLFKSNPQVYCVCVCMYVCVCIRVCVLRALSA